ncbi:MAG: threonine synthase [Bacilli bacterium]|nr:threonine synthase [Bacilli bacterium]
MFYSTRDDSKFISASKAMLLGIASDGGLYLPKEFHHLSIEECLDLSYTELAYKILRPYLDDFSDEEVKNAIEKAYSKKNFLEKTIGLKHIEGKSFLELFHGPTLTFKDMALSLLPHLMEVALKKHGQKKLHILTATSGDTGSAVLSAFRSLPTVEVSVLYPNGGISYVQERQMLSFSSSTARAYALESGNFDDCQTLIKKTMLEGTKEDAFSSANSINPFRLLPQIVYYYAAYVGLVKEGKIKLGEKIDAIVPTGNFGDVFAGYLAKLMGCPIEKLVIASNPNRILPDFLASGKYDLRERELLKTSSPSMDILISSNLERLLYLSCHSSKTTKKWMEELKSKKYFEADKKTMDAIRENFEAYCIEENESLGSIVSLYEKEKYLIDPHTSVAYEASFKRETKNLTLIVSTASPLKFPDTICECFGEKYENQREALSIIDKEYGVALPAQLKAVLENKTPRFLISSERFHKRMLKEPAYKVSSPATSANLGPGFDVLGVALSINNQFLFEKNNKDSLKGFSLNGENLVLKAYKEYFKHFGVAYIPVEITEVRQAIPLSRGLGSSASAIVAGLLGANAICNELHTKEELLEVANKMEGHPDNVSPCLLGGLCESHAEKGKVSVKKHEINASLKALLYIPEQEVSTEEARYILPKKYDFDVKEYQKERIPLLLEALKNGDLKKIKEAMEDKIHVPYRSKLIDDYSLLKEECDKAGLPMTISGSGSTLLVIYKNDEQVESIISGMSKKKTKYPYRFIEASFNKCLVALRKKVD